MPTDVAIVVALIVFVFVLFGLALAWASYSTRNFRAPGTTYDFQRESQLK
jgi:hypothetical protein